MTKPAFPSNGYPEGNSLFEPRDIKWRRSRKAQGVILLFQAFHISKKSIVRNIYVAINDSNQFPFCLLYPNISCSA